MYTNYNFSGMVVFFLKVRASLSIDQLCLPLKVLERFDLMKIQIHCKYIIFSRTDQLFCIHFFPFKNARLHNTCIIRMFRKMSTKKIHFDGNSHKFARLPHSNTQHSITQCIGFERFVCKFFTLRMRKIVEYSNLELHMI